MSETVAPFCWYELMTGDLDAAVDFYRDVVGWSACDHPASAHRYVILSAGDGAMGGVAGAMALPQPLAAAGVPPHWIGYVRVEDVDAMLPRLTAAGGAVHKPAEDIPGVGRFAVVADPHGAAFVLFREAVSPPEGMPKPDPMAPGRVGWHELHAGDREAAFAFYSALFGWTETERMDMGPMGFYRLFATGGQAVGGMMTRMPQTPRPFWAFYFNVEAIDAAIERLTAAGGSVVHGPMEVPGGAWIVQAIDPQGAFFALVAPKR
jgi:predicted enzyme related to lactoylglutathione lyase